MFDQWLSLLLADPSYTDLNMSTMSRKEQQDGDAVDLSDIILYADDVVIVVLFSCLSQLALVLRLWQHFLVEAGLVINWQKTKVMIL